MRRRYGASKKASEDLLLSTLRAYNASHKPWRLALLRYFNVVGADPQVLAISRLPRPSLAFPGLPRPSAAFHDLLSRPLVGAGPQARVGPVLRPELRRYQRVSDACLDAAEGRGEMQIHGVDYLTPDGR